MILGDDRPAIREQTHVSLARVHHRLDRENHAGDEFLPGPWFAVVQDLWILMEDPADAMAAVFAYHRVVLSFDERLDGVTDVAQPGPGPHLPDTDPHGLTGYVHQPL